MPQFVYIDETGDTGFKFNKGSSRFFIVTLLIVTDPLPIHTAVEDLRVALGYRADSEFKFYRSLPAVRRQFLQMVCRQDVMVRALVIDKHLMTQPYMRKRETFYNYLVKLVLQHDNGRLREATVILDQREKNKKSQQSAATYLRRELNAGDGSFKRIAEIRYHESGRDNLLQVVDMCSGAIGHRFTKDEHAYMTILRPKLDDLWIWRPYQ